MNHSVKRSNLLTILGLVVVSALVGIAWNTWTGAGGKPVAETPGGKASFLSDLDFREVAAGVKRGSFHLMDARTASEFERGHLPGAQSVPVGSGTEELFRVRTGLRTDARPVVVYCAGVLCEDADELATRLHGIAPDKQIFIYRGGWEEWQDNARP